MDSDYEFNHCSDSEDEHENEAMETLIKNDALEDSGYCDKLSKSDSKNIDDDIVGADALLELASKACAMKPLSVASSEASDSTWEWLLNIDWYSVPAHPILHRGQLQTTDDKYMDSTWSRITPTTLYWDAWKFSSLQYIIWCTCVGLSVGVALGNEEKSIEF